MRGPDHAPDDNLVGSLDHEAEIATFVVTGLLRVVFADATADNVPGNLIGFIDANDLIFFVHYLWLLAIFLSVGFSLLRQDQEKSFRVIVMLMVK